MGAYREPSEWLLAGRVLLAAGLLILALSILCQRQNC